MLLAHLLATCAARTAEGAYARRHHAGLHSASRFEAPGRRAMLSQRDFIGMWRGGCQEAPCACRGFRPGYFPRLLGRPAPTPDHCAPSHGLVTGAARCDSQELRRLGSLTCQPSSRCSAPERRPRPCRSHAARAPETFTRLSAASRNSEMLFFAFVAMTAPRSLCTAYIGAVLGRRAAHCIARTAACPCLLRA